MVVHFFLVHLSGSLLQSIDLGGSLCPYGDRIHIMTPSDTIFSALNKISEKPLGSSGPFYLSDGQMNISCVCGSPLLKDLTLPLTWERGLTMHIRLILKQFEEFSGSCKLLQLYSAQTVPDSAICRLLRHSPQGTVDLFMLWIFWTLLFLHQT